VNKKKTLRIVHILSGDLWAGAEVLTVNLLKGLTDMEICGLLAIVLNQGRVAEALKCAGVDTIIFDESAMELNQIITGVRKVLHTFKPEIVHAHRYKENLVSYLATRGFNNEISLLSTIHGMPENNKKKTFIKSIIIQKLNYFLLCHRFDRCVAVSHELKSRLVTNFKFQSKKIKVIHNGIYLPGKVNKIIDKQFVVGTCGRFFPVKNYKLFVKIASQIRKTNKNIYFVLAGDGPEREKLKHLCNEYGLNSKFAMPGYIEDMGSFYMDLDLFINTSLHEGIPMSVLEAMGYGIPVIAPCVGGLSEIIDNGVDGYLIPQHNSELFSNKCLELFSDQLLLKKTSQAAREKIEKKFSVERMAEEYYKLYQEITH
jgi:glycosyltransferase involved in cell wall biosynthesis